MVQMNVMKPIERDVNGEHDVNGQRDVNSKKNPHSLFKVFKHGTIRQPREKSSS